ncbi:MAG TPA: hypothetical protein VD886_01960 [Herpetosiphonaceae bacterium]|nr:hypothetical protein [Herpetosiphonaceae bacterium]
MVLHSSHRRAGRSSRLSLRLLMLCWAAALGIASARPHGSGAQAAITPISAAAYRSDPAAPEEVEPLAGSWEPIADGLRAAGAIEDLVVAPDGDRYANARLMYLDGDYRSGLFRWHAGAWSQLAAYTRTDSINAMAWGHDSLYVAGTFTEMGGVPADRLARWDGQQWSAVGSGFAPQGNNTPTVYDLAFDQGILYVGGVFSSFDGVAANGLARWDGAAASALGSFSRVDQVAANGGNVYVVEMSRTLRAWNGTEWSKLAAGWQEWVVGTLLAGNGQVFASDGEDVYRWTGSEWTHLYSGERLRGTIGHLAMLGGTLYAGVGAKARGGVPQYVLARWNGTAWERQGAALAGVTAMAAGPDGIYLSAIASAQGPVTTALWRWDGTGVVALDAQVERMTEVAQLEVVGGAAYAQFGSKNAEGYYTDAFTKTALMEWKDGAWSNLWPQLSPPIAGATLGPITAGDDGILYGIASLGGTEQVVGYDGTDWFTATLPIIPPSEAGYVFTSLRVISPTAIYLTGSLFSALYSEGAGKIALWDGTDWTMIDLKIGVERQGYAADLQQCGSHLYFVGWSQWPSGFITAKHLYELHPSTAQISRVALPYHYVHVEAIECLGDDVYLGGHFVAAPYPEDEIPDYEHLLRWDGSAIEPIEVAGEVNALAADGTTLYAGGKFTAIDGVNASNMARWDGESWQPLGQGVAGHANDPVPARVTQLAVWDGDVYVGGQFWFAGGMPARSLAIWHAAEPIQEPAEFRLSLPLLTSSIVQPESSSLSAERRGR